MSESSEQKLPEHSIRFLEMAFRTDRRGAVERADGYGKRTGDCGDTVEIYLKINDGKIKSVSFELDGCLNTSACANAVAELATGKTIDEAWEITPEFVAEYLETLPEDHFHCAELAVGAFYLALENYRECERSPWKKLYR